MKLNVAYDKNGRIVAAAEAGSRPAGDRPIAPSGMSVAELDVPSEFHGKKFTDYVHRLHVDVAGKKLVAKR
jgi:hypothetical protein